MFTGIVTNQGIITQINKINTEKEIILTSNLDLSIVEVGQSIACNGACLTVTKIAKKELHFFVSKETLDKTTIDEWKVGEHINLELAMAANGRFDGHMVTGHIDCKATVKKLLTENESHILHICLPNDFMNYIVEKGSAAINGVSLTVNDVFDGYFSINIIPHTWKETNFKDLEEGAQVNFEADIVAKYVNKFNYNK